jgi:ribosomal protein S12 methylthiotransferase
MRNSSSFHIITLGCPKNVTDSESMAAVLEKSGMQEVLQPEEADVVIINTCCFIEPAKQETINTILETAGLTEETGGSLIVTGCLPQRYKEEIADIIPEVDSWMGLEDLGAITEVVEKTLEGRKIRKFTGQLPEVFQHFPRRYSTLGTFGYLKIAEGCSHKCCFCVIPEIRGSYRSLPLESVEEEARELINSGRREIVLVAQDTTLYGVDLYGKSRLDELLVRLASLEGLEMLRLMYAYPTTLTDAVLKTIASEEKICKYVDIPLQHSHPDVLRKMGRPFDERYTTGVVERIKEIIPEVVIRTAFIVGHPGETEKRFQHLVDFVKRMEFYNAGVFDYSPEENTKSALEKTRVSRAEAERRRDYLMSVQHDISLNLRKKMKGKALRALLEQVLEDETDGKGMVVHLEGDQMKGSTAIPSGVRAIGRTVYDAPEIDGLLYIKGKPPEKTFFTVEITGALPYDLVGKVKDI